MTEDVIKLLESSLSSDQMVQAEVYEKFLSLYKDIDFIILLFQIFNSHDSEIIRKVAVIQIKNICRHINFMSDDFSDEFKMQLKTLLLESLSNSKDISNSIILSDAANYILKYLKSNLIFWEEYALFSFNLLNNEETAVLGLIIWTEICSSVPDEFNAKNCMIFYSKFCQFLKSSVPSLRRHALDFFYSFLGYIDLDFLQENADLVDLIKNEIHISVNQVEEPEEPMSACILATKLINDVRVFQSNLVDILSFVTKLVKDSKVPLKYRESLQTLINIGPQIIPTELFLDVYEEYLEVSLQLSIQVIETNEIPVFVTEFVHYTMSHSQIASKIIKKIFELILEGINSSDISIISGAVYALIGVPELGDEYLFDFQHNLIEVIKFCFQNRELTEVCCNLIDEISAKRSDILSEYSDQISAELFSAITNTSLDCTLQTLNRFLYNIDVYPSNYAVIVKGLIELISTVDRVYYPMLISCITSAVSKVENDSETCYTFVVSSLSPLFRSEADIRGNMFELFSILVRWYPNMILGDIKEILEMVATCFTEDDCFLFMNIAVCLSNFAQNIPNVFKNDNFCQSILSKFLELINAFIQSEINNEIEDDEYDDNPRVLMIRNVLECYASILNEVKELSHNIPEFIDKLKYFITKSSFIQGSALKSLFLLTDIFVDISFDTSDILETILDEIPKAGTSELGAYFYLAISGLYISLYKSLTDELSHKSFTLFIESLNLEYPCTLAYDSPDGARVFDSNVEDNLFLALRQFIYSIGAQIRLRDDPSVYQLLNSLIEVLVNLRNSSRNKTKSYSLHTTSVILEINPNASVPDGFIQFILSCLDTNDGECKNILLSTLNVLARARPTIFTQNIIKDMIKFVEDIWETQDDKLPYFASAVTLWWTLIQISKKPITEEVREVIESWTTDVDDDDIPYTASFISYVIRSDASALELIIPNAVNVLASGVWLTRLVEVEILTLLAQTVSQNVSEDDLFDLLCGNQHYINNVRKNIDTCLK